MKCSNISWMEVRSEMAARVVRARRNVVVKALRTGPLHQLCGELQVWRADADLKLLEKAKGAALVLPFVKGLRLSSQLIYILRKELSGLEHIEVDWGHLLDEDGDSCSPECDVIIHRCGHVAEWDGSKEPVMHFKFINRGCALAVVSCKSFVEGVDLKYAKSLQPYVRHIFFFAECCEPRKVDSLRTAAKKAGYAGFGYLYTYNRETGETATDPKEWEIFFDKVASTVKKAAKKK